MAEINLKPRIKTDIATLGILISALFLTLLIGLIVTFFFDLTIGGVSGLLIFVAISILAGSSMNAFTKLFTTYRITEKNEIILNYEFLNRDKKVFRIDQLTSVRLSRSFLEKLLGLGTVHFEVFGSSQVDPSSGNQSRLQKKFATIYEFDEVFKILNEKLSMPVEYSIYSSQPSRTPNIFFIILSLILLFGFMSYVFIVSAFNYAVGVVLVLSLLLIISILYRVVGQFRLKRTYYSITKNYVEIAHDYLFSKSVMRVPIKKITNISSYKNAISYALFKIGKVTIYTGGTTNPTIPLLTDYKRVENNLSQLVHGGTIDEESSSQDKESKPVKTEMSSPIIIVRFFFFLFFLFFLPLVFAILFVPEIPVFTLGVLAFLFLFSVMIYVLYWKNLKYEIYEFKVIKYSGIISKVVDEIQFKNVKYVSYHKSLILDRLADTGTIHLYTAGTRTEDKTIVSIKEYEQIYKYLEEKAL